MMKTHFSNVTNIRTYQPVSCHRIEKENPSQMHAKLTASGTASPRTPYTHRSLYAGLALTQLLRSSAVFSACRGDGHLNRIIRSAPMYSNTVSTL